MARFTGSTAANRAHINDAGIAAERHPVGEDELLERIVVYIKAAAIGSGTKDLEAAIHACPCPSLKDWDKLAIGRRAELPSIMSLRLRFGGRYGNASPEEFLQAVFELAKQKALSSLEAH